MGVVVWVVIGWMFGYKYVVTIVSENMTSIINQVMSEGSGSVSDMFDLYQAQASDMLHEQKNIIQENIQTSVKAYLQTKLDGLF